MIRRTVSSASRGGTSRFPYQRLPRTDEEHRATSAAFTKRVDAPKGGLSRDPCTGSKAPNRRDCRWVVAFGPGTALDPRPNSDSGKRESNVRGHPLFRPCRSTGRPRPPGGWRRQAHGPECWLEVDRDEGSQRREWSGQYTGVFLPRAHLRTSVFGPKHRSDAALALRGFRLSRAFIGSGTNRTSSLTSPSCSARRRWTVGRDHRENRTGGSPQLHRWHPRGD